MWKLGTHIVTFTTPTSWPASTLKLFCSNYIVMPFFSNPSLGFRAWSHHLQNQTNLSYIRQYRILFEGNTQTEDDILWISSYPVGNYMFKVNNKNTRTRGEMYSKLTMTTPKTTFWFIYCLLWTYFTTCSIDFIVNM